MSDLRTRICLGECFEAEAFRTPDGLLQPTYSWVWNAPVDRAGIDERLEEMQKNGIRGMYIIPEPREFRPTSMRTDLKPEYLTDEFFEMVRYACEKAHSLGMVVWLYDEGGWPSGSACTKVNALRPESCRKTIAARELALRAGERYVPGERAISAFVTEDGAARLVRPGEAFFADTRLTEYWAKPLGGYPGDPLDREGVKLFMRLTHEGYAKHMSDLFAAPSAGGGFAPGSARVQLMFTDEPGAGRLPWPEGFAEAFSARFGYDLAPYVDAIVHDDADADDKALQARIDYRTFTGELFLNNYFAPIQRWCHAHGLLSGGHLDMDHITDGCLHHSYGAVLPLLRAMDVPGVDVIWHQISLPGPDERPCAEGNGFFPRFASSAAAQAGKKYALSESFAIYGQGTTGDEMRYVINFQLVRGINLFNFMSSSYGKTGAYAMVARPSLVSEMPEFSHYRGINDYTARASHLMQLGMPAPRAALLFPARDIWAGGKRREEAIRSFEAEGRRLEEQHVLFDVIDEEALLACERAGDELRLGLARYTGVIVPKGAVLSRDAQRALQGVSARTSALPVCQSPDLRVEARLLEGQGSLYMLFNEAGSCVEEVFFANAPRVYRLYPEDGRIVSCKSGQRFHLEPGEAAFFLAGDCDIPEASGAPVEGEQIVIDGFTLRPLSRLRLDAEGVHKDELCAAPVCCAPGSWSEILGEDFCGEAEYAARVALPRALTKGEGLMISLGRMENYASVYLDDIYLGEIYTQNGRLYVPKEKLSEKRVFTLRLKVSSTGAGAFKRFDMSKTFDPRDIGQYDAKVREVEAKAPSGGLYGPVCIGICEAE